MAHYLLRALDRFSVRSASCTTVPSVPLPMGWMPYARAPGTRCGTPRRSIVALVPWPITHPLAARTIGVLVLEGPCNSPCR